MNDFLLWSGAAAWLSIIGFAGGTVILKRFLGVSYRLTFVDHNAT